ncbi:MULTISPECIES: 2Fe-2S iron-sulfur cluster-binding protein [Mesorhizobium]|uniref:2Fe-2S iron-sulfur cluster-binding protein n=2 Tax=Phyllobacteriaceae TaxID=69277 RepID=UPI001125E6EC|nr:MULTISPECIES: 2Fe-2S iron-sulfur cluster-binding protein [Mesorhizobium]MCA0002765.1 molybdopterin-dependent oxidoreductase [Mesorhizobium sp. B264B2A]MCA0014519.1 molybdopterin-dependent oxidoreductase [Mesorhizobium sp. B294B1A1]MCA0055629.1 molybdopterin-dependent oxidoreductase [Mesorhizobium sp. B261B1A]TPJ40435.1 hypothetical protein FJ437_26395 [Mesorhizobium sp. B2-6-6]MCA0009084.1 molybdopterin-dependent oxidoreductase [Mesorhizobium sp. B264B1B]
MEAAAGHQCLQTSWRALTSSESGANSQVFYPPVQRQNAAGTCYAGVATIAAVAVDTASGGREAPFASFHPRRRHQIVPELVSCQLQGSLAMGVGHALLEALPLYEDGPDRNWNRYCLPHARDVGVWTQTSEVRLPARISQPYGIAAWLRPRHLPRVRDHSRGPGRTLPSDPQLHHRSAFLRWQVRPHIRRACRTRREWRCRPALRDKAFVERFSFQCGYCTPGFVTGATVLVERLKEKPVHRADVESTIEQALAPLSLHWLGPLP